MKKWYKPELLSLGVENTFEDYSVYKPNNSQNKAHWCHAMNGGLGGKCTVDHKGDTDTHTSVNASHHHPPSLGEDLGADKVQNYSKCCCQKAASTGPVPGPS